MVELGGLGFDQGAHLLVARALRPLPPGARLGVLGRHRDLDVHLAAWCRRNGHRYERGAVVKSGVEPARWATARRSGDGRPGRVQDRAESSWGLAARGALVEGGGPELATADLDARPAVWSDLAPRLYAQAAAGQWDPATAAPWTAAFHLDEDVEDAVVQVMTYLVENEQTALQVPGRHLARVHPHYREVLQLLAVQVADEARHVELFTRRGLLRRPSLGVSTVAGRASLDSLLREGDFSVSLFLTSVLGEGTFLHLLSFLERHAPDPVTARVCHLALVDEGRHVAFGMAHVEERLSAEPSFRRVLGTAVERRHATLVGAGGLSDPVRDALVVLAAGSWDPPAVAEGFAAFGELQREMDTGRRRRLEHLGFAPSEAEHLSALHTTNFM